MRSNHAAPLVVLWEECNRLGSESIGLLRVSRRDATSVAEVVDHSTYRCAKDPRVLVGGMERLCYRSSTMAPRKKDKFQSSLQDDMNQDSAGRLSYRPPLTAEVRKPKRTSGRVADEAERVIQGGRPPTQWEFLAKPQRGKPADDIWKRQRRRGRPVA